MQLQHVNIKIFVEGPLEIDLERFIQVFHRWTAEQSLDELLIDVADYRHVPKGPGVVLVGHEADYGMDNAEGRFGLLYNRKAPIDGTNEDRFSQALAAAAKACENLEYEFQSEGPLRFSRNEFQIVINDRAIAPNTPETYDAVEPEVKAFLAKTLGNEDFSIERETEPRRRCGLKIETAQPFDLSTFAGLAATS